MKCYALMCKVLQPSSDHEDECWIERVYEDEAAAHHAFSVMNEKKEIFCWIEECEIELRSGK